MISLALAAAAHTMTYSCVVDPPRNVIVKGESVSSSAIGLPPEMNKWAFELAFRETDDDVQVDLNWPGDPIRVGKTGAALPEGAHDYAFISVDPGPCLFTVTACMFLFTFSEQADGTADILIQPSALGTDGDRSHPFQAFMKGRCTRKADA